MENSCDVVGGGGEFNRVQNDSKREMFMGHGWGQDPDV